MAESKSNTTPRLHSSTNHKIFVQPCDYPVGVLPTGYDVCRKILFIKENKLSAGEVLDTRHVNNTECYKKAAQDLTFIYYQQENLPTVTETSVIRIIKNLYTNYKKSLKERQRLHGYEDYLRKLDRIVDICSCKCPIVNL